LPELIVYCRLTERPPGSGEIPNAANDIVKRESECSVESAWLQIFSIKAVTTQNIPALSGQHNTLEENTKTIRNGLEATTLIHYSTMLIG
jgi:hypothetical protein